MIEKSWKNFHITILRFAIFRSRQRSRSQERRYRRGPSSPRASSSSNSMSPIRKTNRLGKVLNSKDLQAMTKTNTMIVSKGGKLGGKYVDSRDLEDIFHGRERYVKLFAFCSCLFIWGKISWNQLGELYLSTDCTVWKSAIKSGQCFSFKSTFLLKKFLQS